MSQNFPNPFNPYTTMDCVMPERFQKKAVFARCLGCHMDTDGNGVVNNFDYYPTENISVHRHDNLLYNNALRRYAIVIQKLLFAF